MNNKNAQSTDSFSFFSAKKMFWQFCFYDSSSQTNFLILTVNANSILGFF